ncbi:GDSL esterase/lipase At1g74460-like [Cynara cardunculus var. scolymus]|uniref:GDSL esterase/lipase At1g74460-like n=1 Tax=Cynara cardunculus var. scolymus TaxID=59895 RepID=UPI000D628BB7|nr:GDSL esterase/lipase At1g74460-like [Cynara cardunculus var. scolymus]
MNHVLAKVALGESVTSPPPFQSLYDTGNTFSANLVKAIDFDPMRPWETPTKDFNFASMEADKENPARGINFASSGSGIIDKTSAIDQSVSITQQLMELMFVYGNLTATIGAWKTQLLFEKSTFFLCLGNNDINFFVMTGQKMEVNAYIDELIDSYNSTLRVLYNLGVRKFGIFGIPYVGCVPLVRVTVLTGECSKKANDMAIQFNDKLEKLLCDMMINFKGMVYSFANSYDVLKELMEHPKNYNLTNTIDACCGLGRFNAMSNCNPLAKLCKNRKEYLFWDIAHPTQYAASIIINKFQFGGPNYARPINWSKLASL